MVITVDKGTKKEKVLDLHLLRDLGHEDLKDIIEYLNIDLFTGEKIIDLESKKDISELNIIDDEMIVKKLNSVNQSIHSLGHNIKHDEQIESLKKKQLELINKL